MIENVRTITRQYVEELIDFAPTKAIKSSGIGDLQKDGCVALFNMLVSNGVAYLADEVGMGKTYIGLAVMHLLRYQKPDARVLIITPRRNIQEKWASDLISFVQQNWRHADHRVKTPQGSPDWPIRLPDRLSGWVRDLHTEEAHDTVLRMTSFSLGINNENVNQEVNRFRTGLGELADKEGFEFDTVIDNPSNNNFSKRIRACVEKAAEYDLIIVDEAHNLKYGYREGESSSNRNENMCNIFAPVDQSKKPLLLLLSATPMENGDPLTMVRQFEVFGRDRDLLKSPQGGNSDSIAIRQLADPIEAVNLRELQQRLIVRRVGEMRLRDGSRFTRNMYRREWRAGGVDEPDKPMLSASISERLINAVIQKNVFDLLQAKSGGRFRIGSLESFEIYAGAASSLTEVDEGNGQSQQVLPDQRLIADLCESYRLRFSEEVPHPKLNAVTRMLSRKINQREKALVFVRRVATTTDLASRVSQEFDKQIIESIKAVVQESEHELLDRIDRDWREKRSKRIFEEVDRNADAVDDGNPEQQHDISDEEEDSSVSEVVPSMFTWFFRGEHKGLLKYPNILSGRRLREQLEARNRFCLILEENYVDWVLLRPENVIDQLVKDSGQSEDVILTAIAKRTMPDYLKSDHGNFRRSFHAIQLAALSWMAEQPCYKDIYDNLLILVSEIFGVPMVKELYKENHSSQALCDLLSSRGIYPSLARCTPESKPWSTVARGVFEQREEKANFDFRKSLRRREQIRLMQMADVRHGAPLIDLYLAAIVSRRGTFSVEGTSLGLDADKVAVELVKRWQELSDSSENSCHTGLDELVQLKDHFDLIKKLNFPFLDMVQQSTRPLDLPLEAGQGPKSDGEKGMRTVRRFLNQEMAGQSPAAAAKGGQSDERRHRITTHFRMPGMPWVVVATNVYEEGVDLHTFCRTVVHHGISHTASSVEQRTGRVDRIGGLVQREARKIAGQAEFSDDHKIQSLFPYQNDTFEKFQVRKVLSNCNRFLRALHYTEKSLQEDREMSLEERHDIPDQITEPLLSPFDVKQSAWLQGQLNTPDHSSNFSEKEYLSEAEKFERLLTCLFSPLNNPGGQGLERRYNLGNVKLRLVPKSHREGDHLIIEFYIDDNLEISFNALANGTGWAEQIYEKLNEECIFTGCNNKAPHKKKSDDGREVFEAQ